MPETLKVPAFRAGGRVSSVRTTFVLPGASGFRPKPPESLRVAEGGDAGDAAVVGAGVGVDGTGLGVAATAWVRTRTAASMSMGSSSVDKAEGGTRTNGVPGG